MTSSSDFVIFVTHGQVAVFDPSLDSPFNEWTDQHLIQGFSWRPGSVSFRTLEECCAHGISMAVLSAEPRHPFSSIRVIDVPFRVPLSGQIEIASIADSARAELLPGTYQLRFQIKTNTMAEDPSLELLFWPCQMPIFKILLSDFDAPADEDLLLAAAPA